MFDLLAINETRLDETISDNQISINGYDLIRKDRLRHAGGVCIYIKSNIENKIHNNIIPENTEAICVEILNPSSKRFYIIACYRPPSSDASFFRCFDSIITKLDDNDKDIIIIGDLASKKPNYQTKQLYRIMETYQLQQLINEPTRITEKTLSTSKYFN